MFSLEWATFAVSAIGALGALAGGYIGVSDRLWQRGEPMRREAALWKLLVGGRFDGAADGAAPWRPLTPKRDSAAGATLEISRIELVSPWGARIAPLESVLTPGADGKRPRRIERPVPARAGRRIVFKPAEGLYSDGVISSLPRIGTESSPDLGFFIELPPSRWWRRSVIVKIRVHAEDVSSARRRTVITLKTALIVLPKAETASSNSDAS